MMEKQVEREFIFLDACGKRWPRLRLVLLLAAVIFLVGGVLFVQSLWVMPQLRLPPSILELKSRLKVLQRLEAKPTSWDTSPLWLKFTRNPSPHSRSHSIAPKPAAPHKRKVAEQQVRLGFFVGWDRDSHDSLRAHAHQLTHLCLEWLTVTDAAGTLSEGPDSELATFSEENDLVLLPLLNNLVNDVWQPEAVEGLANGPEATQDKFFAGVIARLRAINAGGIIIDWGQLDPSYRQTVTKLLQRMAAALHREGFELWLCVPMGKELQVFDLEALAPSVDRFVAMLHDQNSEQDSAGPIASKEWFEGWLHALLGYGSSDQWIISLGSYGYDWASGETRAEPLGFRDVMTRAVHAGLKDCRSEAPSYNPHFFYEDAGIAHTVWFLDTSTFINQIQKARQYLTGGIAIYRLGLEDPHIWEALSLIPSHPPSVADLTKFETLTTDDGVANVGRGEFLTVNESRSDGLRKMTLDAKGQIVESYEKFPSYLTICHQGKGEGDEVAISFDDGPDPRWTPQLLDILKEKGVKASFFVVGQKVEKHPELASRIVREGHEIGVHTYTHPNLAEVSDERAVLELNATQRLIESVTGRSTVFFRPPYNADSYPHNPEEITPVVIAQQLGYLTVSQDIDPEDYNRPGVDAIVQKVRHHRRLGGKIVLLHDAGGNRGQTVQALPQIIEYLQARGDRIVPLSRLLKEQPEALMPQLQKDQQKVTRLVSESGFFVLHRAESFLWSFVLVATALIVLRTLIVALLASRYDRRQFDSEDPFQPPVSILIAAFNEGKVIEHTLRKLLDTDYGGPMEVVVVDDGSKDNTAEVVARIAQQDSRVQLIRQPNMGKALALRGGMEATTRDIIVTLDADTHFQRDTIGRLIQPFKDANVGAVSGHAKVGNLGKFITRCQALEYTCGFNLDRRAYHQLQCITVVPGAVSALRRGAVIAAGGISTDTLAEDTDLTLSLHRHGYQVAYVADAIAWTEAPETFATLAKQRFRWAFGTLQCLWKHRDLVFSPKYKALGWFSLPAIWFFQILLVAIGPILDALLVLSLLLGASSTLLVYFISFMLMDLLCSALACLLEREPLGQIWLTIPMRIIYRPLLSWVVWKSIIRAVQGVWVNWGKIERTASLTANTESSQL